MYYILIFVFLICQSSYNTSGMYKQDAELVLFNNL